MRAMISPIIILGIILITSILIFNISKSEMISNDINNEIKNDVKIHKLMIKKIEYLSELNGITYSCSKYYYCGNLTTFLSNVTECLNENGYDYSLKYDGEFYIEVNGFKDILNERRLNCG